MPIEYGPSLPPVPVGMSVAEVSLLREQLQEDTLQTLLTYMARRGDGGITAADLGATGNGVTDDTSALQAAITLAKATGRKLTIAPGTYRISSTLEIADCTDLEVNGGGFVLLQWAGTSGLPMLRIKNSQYPKWTGINFQGNTAGGSRPSCFIQSISDTTGSRIYAPTGNQIEDCILGTGTADEATYGIKYENSGTSSDTNNSEGYHKNILIRGVTEAAVYLGHSQAKAHKFVHGGVVGAKYGFYTVHGSFSTDEFAVSNCSESAYHLGSPNDPILIQRMTSEGCARFITTAGPAAAVFLCTVIGGRFATNSIHADGKAIKFKFPGLNLLGTLFDAGGIPALIELTNSAGSGAHNIIGCAWNSPDSNLQTPIVIGSADVALNMEGCMFSDAVGAMIAQKHSGQLTVTGAATTQAVTFAIPEYNSLYLLTVTPVTVSGAATAGSSRVRSVAKTTTGFTVTVEAAPGGTETVVFDWSLTRK